MKKLLSTLLLSLIPLLLTASAQSFQAANHGTSPKYEFRGAWIATVANLDWPKSRDPQRQQQDLIAMLDGLEAAGVNAVFFQVRTESDALYASEIEPWSYWLTGEQGRAPSPAYDPLAFAIEEAHKRGMELHAWFNPYRADRGSSYPKAASHVTNQHPEWLLTFGDLKILDPGIPAVRDYVTRVVMDVVRRYDIDGVHFDDYFYPYPPNQITNQDTASFAAHSRGITNLGEWRRGNVNLFVSQVSDSIEAVKPEVAFGISPFGIWKNGVPSGIVGLDAYNVIYADAVAWLQAQDLDYLTPQLYWAFGGGQDYGRLAPWWASQMNGRHLYPGHGLYRSDRATFGGNLFRPTEVPNQVRFNRNHPDIQGSVFFRALNITGLSSQGFSDTLRTDLYRHPALTPVMPWRNTTAPGTPGALAFEWTSSDSVTLQWTAPESAESEAAAQFYAVYRVRASAAQDLEAALADASNLVEVTGQTRFADRPLRAEEPYHYYVTAVSANSVESAPAGPVVLEGRAVSTERTEPFAFSLHPNYPDPFNPTTTVSFSLDRPGPVTARIYNVLGQEVAVLARGERYAAGTHAMVWDGRDGSGRIVSSGTYLYVLEVGGRRATEVLTLVK